jgi:hypothetical protein
MDIARTRARGSQISKKYVRVREGQKDVMERTTQSTGGKSAPKQQHNGGEGAQRGLVCAQSKGPRREPTHMHAVRQGGKEHKHGRGRRVTHLQKYVQVMAETPDGDEPRKAHRSREHNGGEGGHRADWKNGVYTRAKEGDGAE